MKTKLSKQEILERVGTMAQLAGIRPYVLREGRKNGVSAADLWNGSGLSMTVLSDRASDIYSVTYQGRSLCWLSGVGASGPWFAHNGPFEWDKNFGGGMLATCGLTTAGLPSADAGETLNLHGDIANLPAEEVNCRTFWEGDDYWLEYSSRTYQAKPYAENLCLTRQIRMRMGDNTIYLHDRVENLGFSATPLMLIYHMNFGYPLLDEGAKLYLTYQDRFPTSDLASQTVDQIGRVTPPDNGYRARAYNHTVRADAEGYAYASLLNEELQLGATVKFRADTLDKFNLWKCLRKRDYVIGLEPCNCRTWGRDKAREHGDLVMLEPMESKDFSSSPSGTATPIFSASRSLNASAVPMTRCFWPGPTGAPGSTWCMSTAPKTFSGISSRPTTCRPSAGRTPPSRWSATWARCPSATRRSWASAHIPRRF